MNKFWPHLLFLLLWFSVMLYSQVTQPMITLENHLGWDGTAYAEMAARVWADAPLAGEKPFCYRIATPWLVGQLPGRIPLARGFLLINLVAMTLMPFLFLRFWRAVRAPTRLLPVVGLILTMGWHTPLRFLYFYPASTDPWMWVLLLWLLPELVHDRLPVWVYWISLIAAMFFREFLLSVPVAALLRILVVSDTTDRKAILFRQGGGVILSLLTLVLVHLTIDGSGEYGFVRHAVGMFYYKPFPVWVHGWFGAFGLTLVLMITDFAWMKQTVRQWPVAAFWLFSVWSLGWIGGSDTIRIMFWSAPVALWWLAMHWQHRRDWYLKKRIWLAILFVQILSQRWGLPIPDYPSAAHAAWPLFTPIGLHVPYLHLEPQHAPHWISKIALFQYLLFAGYLLLNRLRMENHRFH